MRMSPTETGSGPCNEGAGRLIALAAVVALLVGPAAAREEKKEDLWQEADSASTPLQQAETPASEFDVDDVVFTAPPRTIKDILAGLPDPTGPLRDCSDVSTMTVEAVFDKLDKLRGEYVRGQFLASQASHRFETGDVPNGIKLQRRAISVGPRDRRGWLAVHIAKLAVYYAYALDLDAAESTMSRAEAKSRSMTNFTGTKWQFGSINFHMDVARAVVAGAIGELREAEGYVRRAIATANRHSLYGRLFNFLNLSLANVLIRQGRLAEAENAVRVARRLAYHPSSRTLTLAHLAEVLFEQGRFRDAAELARRTAFLYRNDCTPPTSLRLAFVNDLLGRSLVIKGRWDAAATHYASIREDMAGDPDSFDRLFTGNPYWALALMRTGAVDEAVRQLEIGLDRNEDRFGADHYSALEIRGYLAMARLARGELREALAAFREIIPELIERSREANYDGSSSNAKSWRLKIILEA